MRIIVVFILLFFTKNSFAQKNAYQLFTKEGKKIAYEKMIKSMVDADIILFGELHNNPICHWLQLELTSDIYNIKKENTVLGAEMFESDNQLILDEYLSGLILKKHFTTEAKVWLNNETDYQPLVDFSKENNIPFIATNVPRRYANVVARKGIEELQKLNKEQLNYIAPLPIDVDLTLPAYKMFLEMGMGHGNEMTPEKMAKSQAVKDATMAHFILKNWRNGKTFIHYNGTYHSDNFESINWYLLKQNPDLKIITISTVEQKNIEKLNDENTQKGDFILATPNQMTKTY